MPFFRAGSLTSEEAWSLTAYILRMNDREIKDFTLDETSGAAISVHHKTSLPESQIPGGLILVGVSDSCGGRRERLFQTQSAVGQTKLLPSSAPADHSRGAIPFSIHIGRGRSGGLSLAHSAGHRSAGNVLLRPHVRVRRQSPCRPSPTSCRLGASSATCIFGRRNSSSFVMSIHLLRVTLTGAYAPPRRFNHILGVGLLAFILLLDFTGYVLRWDEGIHWALVVGANMLKTVPLIGEGLYQFVIGGSEPGDCHRHPFLCLAHFRADGGCGYSDGLARLSSPPRWRHCRPAADGTQRERTHLPL